MENKYRNELEIDLAGTKILLRPTFENIAAMEENVGSVTWLTWKFSRGAGSKNGPIEPNIKAMPSLTESAKIIYYNQAATKPDNPFEKLYSLEQIWDLVSQEGARVSVEVIKYIGRITAGNKADEVTTATKEEDLKKSP